MTAENLSLSLVEYVTLTRENYQMAEYYSITMEVNPFPPPQLGSYWGFNSPNLPAMFIKEHVLPRSSLLFSELIDILGTEFINQYVPRGKKAVIYEKWFKI